MTEPRFQGQQHRGQHRRTELVKNAMPCGICQGAANKLPNGTYVCQENKSHMADGVVGIWSDLTYAGSTP